MKNVIAIFIFILLSLFITFPLIFHLGDYITGYGDELSYSWIYASTIKALLSFNLNSLINTNIFYPYQIYLSNSDPNIVAAIMAIPAYILTGEPISTVNFTIISSITLMGISIYFLTFFITKNYPVSIFTGILVVLSPAYLSFHVHIQMLTLWPYVFSLLFILEFIKFKKTKYFIFSLVLFILQTYNNFLAGYFTLFSYLIIFICLFLSDKKSAIKLLTKKNIAIFLVSILLIIPIMIPYFNISKEFNYVRDIRDSVHFALQPEDLLYSSSFSRLQLFLNTLPINRVSQNNEFKPGYLGLIFSILVIFVIYFFIKNFKRNNFYLNSFIGIGLTGLILSLGPVLHLGRHTVHWPTIIPLPYAIFYYIIPGFKGFRNSARWEVLFIIAIAIVIGIVLDRIIKKYSYKKQILVICFLSMLILLEHNFPMRFEGIQSSQNFPKEHIWLTKTSKNIKYIEMPIYNWTMHKYANTEFFRMYYSTLHLRRTVNGGGGFTPQPWQDMIFKLNEDFPSDQTVSELKNLDLDYIIVHKDEYDKLNRDKFIINKTIIPNGESMLKELNSNKNIRLVKEFEDVYIYQFN